MLKRPRHSGPEKRLRYLGALAGAAAAAVVLGACGGSSGKSLTQAQFVTAANAACTQGVAEATALPPPGTSISGATSYVAQVEPIEADVLRKLSALNPPSQDQSLWSSFLADERYQAALLPKIVAALQAGNQPQAQQLTNALQARDNKALAIDLGLSECAKGANLGGGSP